MDCESCVADSSVEQLSFGYNDNLYRRTVKDPKMLKKGLYEDGS